MATTLRTPLRIATSRLSTMRWTTRTPSRTWTCTTRSTEHTARRPLMHIGFTSHLVAQVRLVRVIPSMHAHLCVVSCLSSSLCPLFSNLVSPFSFQPFLMFTSALNEKSRSNPLCDFRLGTVVTSDYETLLTLHLMAICCKPTGGVNRTPSHVTFSRVCPHTWQCLTRHWLKVLVRVIPCVCPCACVLDLSSTLSSHSSFVSSPSSTSSYWSFTSSSMWIGSELNPPVRFREWGVWPFGLTTPLSHTHEVRYVFFWHERLLWVRYIGRDLPLGFSPRLQDKYILTSHNTISKDSKRVRKCLCQRPTVSAITL